MRNTLLVPAEAEARLLRALDGTQKLLDAYSDQGGEEIAEVGVRFHELAILLEWHARALARPGGGAEAGSLIQRVPALLR